MFPRSTPVWHCRYGCGAIVSSADASCFDCETDPNFRPTPCTICHTDFPNAGSDYCDHCRDELSLQNAADRGHD